MRDFQKFNDALLAKISWRLHENHDCLLGKVLKSKYYPESNILLAEETSSLSHGWRGVLIGRDLLARNIGWAVGDGRSINIWHDPWLSMSKQERPMGPPTEQSAELSVSDLLITGTGLWDRNKIQRLLPEYEERILCLKPSVTGAPDKLFWLGTKSGDYTSKSGYYIAIEEDMDAPLAEANFNWKKNVWNLSCAPKVKHFVWKVLKRAIPVGERLVERHIDVDPRCKRCGEIESITHLLFHCRFSQKVWQLAPFTTDKDYRGIIDLISVWPLLCTQACLPPTGIPSGSLFPWILWTIWKARNKFVFEGFSASPEDTLSSAIVLAREWTINRKSEPSGPSGRAGLDPITQSGALISRSDAAWESTSTVAGLGWCLLSPSQKQEFRQRREFVASPLMAEGLALREAVLTCRNQELREVGFESDSTQLIKCVNSGDGVAEIHTVVSDILTLVEESLSVSFVWIPRDKNVLADSLAKSAMIVVEPLVVEEAVNASTYPSIYN